MLFLPTTWSKIFLGGAFACVSVFVFFVTRGLLPTIPSPQSTSLSAAPIPETTAPSPSIEVFQRSMPPPSDQVSKRLASVISDPSPRTELPTHLSRKTTSFNGMNLQNVNLKRTYLYTFEGMATYQRKPFPDASIAIRINVGDQVQTVGGGTRADGTYSITVPVEARLDQPVDWAIEAHTPEFKKVELVGRRIATEDTTNDLKITLQNTLALLPQ
jgi:hypothetical protein